MRRSCQRGLTGGRRLVVFELRRQQERNDEERSERQRADETGASKSNVAWWDVLGVDPSASLEEVKASYRTKIKKYHPDRVEGLGEEFIALAPKVPVRTTITTYPLDRAEKALSDLRAGRFEGSAVIVP